MPRTVEDVLQHAEQLAERFENYQPTPDDERDSGLVMELQRAVVTRAAAERRVRDAVGRARDGGLSWALIGSLIGTSGEAARQRYGGKTARRRA